MIFRESETVELKAIVTENIKKEIIAFANCEGGKLYVGVADNGEVVGLSNPDDIALQISNMVRDAIRPDLSMFLHYETLEFGGKRIIAVDIQRGTGRPYYIANKGLRPEGVYVRQGFSSVPATDTVIRRMIKETDGDCFEDMRSMEQNLTFEAAEKEFSSRNVPFESVQRKTLGIMSQDDVYTNLGQLLSDQCVHTVKVAAFQGMDQSIFKDRKEFTGSLFKQMADTYDYIDFHNQTGSIFEGLHRIDTRDYPEVAIKEALLNSFVHREYLFRASSFISIYTDRIEFTSIGGLVPGITLNDVMMGVSVCRNVKLANVFYRLELIEAYGTGMQKIMNAYKGSGVTPKIETSDNAFKIILPNLNTRNEMKSEGKVIDYLDENEKKIIELARTQGSITRREVEKLLNISQTTSGRLLKRMLENGLIVQKGKGKNTQYYFPQ